MSPFYYLLTALWLLPLSAFCQSDPQLVLNTNGHQGLIRDIAVTNDGRFIISAGDDKVIRIWNAQTGLLTEEIRGQQSEGSLGKIFAMALSPDNRWLAVGGWLKNGDSVDDNFLRLYDFQKRELKALLKGHTDVVHCLKFSNDSRHLVSGSSDNTAMVWDMTQTNGSKGTTPAQVLRGHTRPVYDVAMQGNLVVSASYDKTIKFWTLADGRAYASSDVHDAQCDVVAISPDGQTIVSGGDDNRLAIHNRAGQVIQTIDNRNSPSVIRFSPDGQRFLCGRYSNYNLDPVCKLYKLSNKRWELETSFKGFDNTVTAVAFLDNNTVVIGGGSNQEINIGKTSGTVVRRLLAMGKTVFATGISQKILAFTTTFTQNKGRSTLTTQFDLINRQLSPLPPGTEVAGPILNQGDYSLTHQAGGLYGFDDAVLQLRQANKTSASITRGSTDGYRHNCYGFGPNQTIVSGGSNGRLYMYDFSGKVLSEFMGHTSDLRGISVSADGQWLVSGGEDQVIKLWPLAEVGKKTVIEPLLSLFVGTDNEWVLWHPSGYYDASPDGEKYMGWHINRGYDQIASYYPATSFRKKFYQPQFITRLVETGSLAAAQQTLTTGRLENIRLLHPPEVSWQIPASRFVTTDAATYRLTALIESASPVQLVKVLVNGRSGYERRGASVAAGSTSFSELVSLTTGDNELEILVRNADGEVSSEKRTVTYQPARTEELFKPTLYVLTIGVSSYQETQLNLRFAHRDAEALATAFSKQSGGLFRQVISTAITNEKATGRGIKKALTELKRAATQRDLVIVSLAGHGVNTANNTFYFLPYDVETSDIEATALKYSDLTDVLGSLPCKVLAFVDACHAGNLVKAGVQRRDLEPNLGEFVRELISDDVGVVVMSASTGKETSQESADWQQGAFTKAVLEGLSGRAEITKDGVISLSELDRYVTERVKQLTNGLQHPVTYNEGRIPNSLPLCVIK
ncbi:caspase family protein [Spirosoma sordidisoli]|uniref:Peptidase C14 caspase domain-containing protein n=1 Tax=Spirosoma sordidisoli TaxID=2502893 RepID=A0A4Q2UHE9_9BACT|nr:caspase family protein [Spirosoma sordidisoli]RYC66871.1 hypothetical protein EQG79_27605 [Spirosoma sordidisoli]